MRGRNSLKAYTTPVTEESRYARALTAGWLLRILNLNVEIGQDFLACFAWSVSGLRPVLAALKRDISAERDRIKAEEGVQPARAAGSGKRKRPLTADLDDALDALRDVLKFPDDKLHSKFAPVLDNYSGVFGQSFKNLARQACIDASAVGAKPLLFKNGEDHLAHLFGLDEDSIRICVFVFLLSSFSPAERYLYDELELDRFHGRRTLAYVLGMTPGKCRSIINELRHLGIMEVDAHTLLLEDKIYELWDESSTDKAANLFCRPLAGETLPLSAFPLPREEIDHVLALLKPRQGAAAQRPVHILLYGPPGTGKTTFARSVAEHFNVKAWAVPSQYDDEDSGRRASLNACINLATRHKGAFVLADEAERLLDSSIHSFRKTHDKAWINELMEHPGRRIIWITNQVEHIEQAVRRRFTYSLHFEEPGLRERRDLWNQILERHGVRQKMDAQIMQELLTNYTPPVAMMDEAVQQAKVIAGRQGVRSFSAAVLRIVKAHDTLKHNGHRNKRQQNGGSDFALEVVNLKGKGDSREQLDTLLSRLKKADKLLREGQDLGPGALSLLFYGPPGTGKSALARYLAGQLGREVIQKKASDLMSPYVGENEQNIAAAFRDAERDGAVLIIDEADSFIFSRSTAMHSWEASMVNEFLTGLEQCRTFCVCTTNRRTDMDNAAMRRFAFKVAFDYSRSEQLPLLYALFLEPLAGSPLPKPLLKELTSLKNLTPGDFQSVRVRSRLSGQDRLTHKELLAEIRAELAAKLDKVNRNIGF